MNKHATGSCEHCGIKKTVEHIPLHFPRHQQGTQTLRHLNQMTLSIRELLHTD